MNLDPKTLIDYATTAGPAGVIGVLGAAIKWLLSDRKKMLTLLDEARAELAALREVRIDELKESQKLLATSDVVLRDVLATLESSIRNLTSQLAIDEAKRAGDDALVLQQIQGIERAILELRQHLQLPKQLGGGE